MAILGPLIFVGFILLGVFTLANWSVLSAPTALSFVAFQIEAPLGFILLGSLLVFVMLFTTYIVILRTTMLMDARFYARELETQQNLANKAEASRLSELRVQIDYEFALTRDAAEKSRADLGAQIEAIESTLRNSIEESGRSLAAYIGEVDDKLDRSLTPPTA